MRPCLHIALLCAVSLMAIVAVAAHAPIPQPAGYHEFADRRTLLGIANFWNVISNLPFLLVGIMGMRELATSEPSGIVPSLRTAYVCLFAGIILVALGSAYYHFASSTAALVWDRLRMTIAFMALFAIVIGEHVDARAGLRLLLIPMILLLFPSRLSHVGFLWAVLGAYVVAKLLEMADGAIFDLDHFVSGHTLKHLVAGFGMYLFLLAVRRRRPVAAAHAPARDTAPAA